METRLYACMNGKCEQSELKTFDSFIGFMSKCLLLVQEFVDWFLLCKINIDELGIVT